MLSRSPTSIFALLSSKQLFTFQKSEQLCVVMWTSRRRCLVLTSCDMSFLPSVMDVFSSRSLAVEVSFFTSLLHYPTPIGRPNSESVSQYRSFNLWCDVGVGGTSWQATVVSDRSCGLSVWGRGSERTRIMRTERSWGDWGQTSEFGRLGDSCLDLWKLYSVKSVVQY